MKLILGLVFQIGGLGVSETRVMSSKGTRVKPHTPTSYLMMPYQSMALTMMNSVGWVGGKTLAPRLSRDSAAEPPAQSGALLRLGRVRGPSS